MRPITPQEMSVIEDLITEAQDAIEQIGGVLGREDPVVETLRNARDFLRGMRDAGQWCAFAKPS